MYGSYMIGYYLGQYLIGALIGGTIPFIIFVVKKRWKLGFLGFLACGLAGLLHPIGAVVMGVLFIVGAVKAYNERK